MRAIAMLVGAAAGVAALLLSATLPAAAQGASALSGTVSSPREGAMEGVVVSAKEDGGTITVSVVSDDKGHFGFPVSRLEPGHYALGIRAVGYDLDGPKEAVVAAGRDTDIDIKLKPTQNLAGQLTNAEWLLSMPGTEAQKRFVLQCNDCHTFARIVESTHDADEFMQVFQRMGGYYPGSTPCIRSGLSATPCATSAKGRKRARWPSGSPASI